MTVTKTGIEWTVSTAGVLLGCSRESAGCENCYAETLAGTRLKHLPLYADLTRPTGKGPRWTGKVKWNGKGAREVLSWRKGRRVFLNSMSDLFHESLSNEQVAVVFAFMAKARKHTFQALTKRTGRAAAWFQWVAARRHGYDGHPIETPFELLARCAREHAPEEFATLTARQLEALHPQGWPLVNVELGASVETQALAYKRVSELMDCPAWVRFLSMEPLLEGVELNPPLCPHGHGHETLAHPDDGPVWCTECDTEATYNNWLDACASPTQRGINWVIVGGDNASDAKARPCDYAWLRAVRDACASAGVPCFVKQVGSHPRMDGSDAVQMRVRGGWTADGPGAPYGRGKPRSKPGKDPLEWTEDLRVQQLPDRSFEVTP